MKKILFLSLILISTIVSAQKINVASYNIRNDNKGDVIHGNGWQQRCPVIAGIVQINDFDIFGMQEVKNNQIMDLLKVLPDYKYIGVGREDGKTEGEYSPIFYNIHKFQLLSSNTFWLSETPDKPGKGWDADYMRVCTWGKFKVRADGFTFWYFNLHADNNGRRAQIESSKLILKKIKEMCSPNDAVILSGDFNVDQNMESYKTLEQSNLLKDSYEIAKFKFAPNGTFNDFTATNFSDSRIDHIFVNNNFTVLKYGILTTIYWSQDNPQPAKDSGFIKFHTNRICTPSDHYPVKVELVYKLHPKNKK